MTCAQGLLRLLWGGSKLECYGTGWQGGALCCMPNIKSALLTVLSFKTITQLRKSCFDAEQSATLFFKLWSPDILKSKLNIMTSNYFYALIHRIVIKIKVQFCPILRYYNCYLVNLIEFIVLCLLYTKDVETRHKFTLK